VTNAQNISIQTAGLAFGGTGLCSYRVDGSCAEHLTEKSMLKNKKIYGLNVQLFHRNLQ